MLIIRKKSIENVNNVLNRLLCQFMSINIQNISVVMMNNAFNPSWFLHATAGDLNLDGSTLHSLKSLVFTAALNDARVCTISMNRTFFFVGVFSRDNNIFLLFRFYLLSVEVFPTLQFSHV